MTDQPGASARTAGATFAVGGKLPAPGEIAKLGLDPANLFEISTWAQGQGNRIVVTREGHLGIWFKNGGMVLFPDADLLVAAHKGRERELVSMLNADPSRLAILLGETMGATTTSVALQELTASVLGSGPAAPPVSPLVDGPELREGLSAIRSLRYADYLSEPQLPLAPLGAETPRWGRDDLKRGEAGSQGQLLDVGIGVGLRHLVGLGDEDRGHRNGEKLSSSNNQLFTGETLGVGQGIDHLWLLGDVEYTRASLDEEDDPLGSSDDVKVTLYGPLAPPLLAFSGIEDTLLVGRIWDPAVAVLPVRDAVLTIDPALGTVVINVDGTFTYTPPINYSGPVTFDFSFTDPRTGLVTSGTVELTVAAVADPILLVGAATGPEDTAIALPLTLDLIDVDGSETLSSVVISGVPATAVLAWNTALPGTVLNDGAGGFTFSGTEADIRALLATVTLTPPVNFSGDINLTIAATSSESNVPPGTPGAGATQITTAPYRVTVIPVADMPPALGGAYTTNEDTAVVLTHSASAMLSGLVDTDGSEVLTLTITGVPAGSTINGRGPDASGAISITQAELDVGLVFLPPPNASGTYNMTLVATSTEQANGVFETNTAPIVVIVVPVNDPPIAEDNRNTAVQLGVVPSTGNIITDTDPVAGIDRDIDSGVLTIASVGGVSVAGATTVVGTYGTLTINPDGSYSYALDNTNPAVIALQHGDTPLIETFGYVLSDNDGGTDTANLIIDITGANDVPDARDNANAVTEDTVLTATGNVVTDIDLSSGTDSDPDGDPLTVTTIGFGASTAPVTATGTTIAGIHGSLTIFPDGSYTYTLTNTDPIVQALAVGETLVETFPYAISDGDTGTDTANLVITINGRNDGPVAVNGPLPPQIGVDSVVDPSSPDFRTYFADPDTTDILTFTATGLPPGLTFNPLTGQITGTPDRSASQGGPLNDGVYQVAITADDGHGGTITRIVPYTITNPAPTARDNANTVTEDIVLVAAGNIITNPDLVAGTDNDPDGDPLSLTTIQFGATTTPVIAAGTAIAGVYGVLTVFPDGSYSYVLTNSDPAVQALAVAETLTETFAYGITDGEGGSAAANLVITINGRNDGPVAFNGPLPPQVDVDSVLDPSSPDFRTYFTDPDSTDTLTFSATGLPLGLTFNPATGQITGTPDHSASQGGPLNDGIYQVQITADDGHGGTLTRTVQYTVSNPAPTPFDNARTVVEDGSTTANAVGARVVGGNVISDANASAEVDNDPDSDPIFLVAVAGQVLPIDGSNLTIVGLHGTLVINNLGVYTYTLNNADPAVQALAQGQSIATPEDFTYTVVDGDGTAGTRTAHLTVAITGVNDAPVAANGPIPPQVDVDSVFDPSSPDFRTYFTDADATDTLTFSATGLPPGLTFNPVTGQITGTPTASASQGGPSNNGVYQVQITADDGNGGTLTRSVQYTVTNPAPTPEDNNRSVVEDGSTTANAVGARVVSGNIVTDPNATAQVDTDPDGDVIRIATVAGFGIPADGSNRVIVGAHGTLVINNTGAYTYTLNNADPAVQALAQGQFVAGFEDFTYTVVDGDGTVGTRTAHLTIDITGVNDAPTASGGPIPPQVDVDGQIDPSSPDFRTFFADADTGDTLTFTVNATTLPLGLTFNPINGQITGTPDRNASQGGPLSNGVYQVEITATDGLGASITRIVQYTVTNPAPDARDNANAVTEDVTLTATGNVITDADLIAGTDIDPDGDPLSLTTIRFGATTTPVVLAGTTIAGAYGSLTIFPDGSYTYTLTNAAAAVQALAVGASLTETFPYGITDGQGGSDIANLVITINGTNDAPVASGGPIPPQVDVDSVNDSSSPDFRTFFSDPDSTDVLTFSATGLPLGLTFDPGTGQITGTPNRSASQGGPLNDGVYQVAITADDGHGGTITRIVQYTVTNPAPDARDNTRVVTEDTVLTAAGNVITDNDPTNGLDSDDDPLTLTTIQYGVSSLAVIAGGTTIAGTYGSLLIRPDGTYTYTLNNTDPVVQALGVGDTLPNEVFTYTVNDGEGGTDTANLIIRINGINDPPVAIDDTFGSIAEDTSIIINVFDGGASDDSDVDGDTLTVTHVQGQPISIGGTVTVPNGTVTMNPDRTLTFTPTANYSGPVSFDYTINDGNGGTDIATVTGNVTPVLDSLIHTPTTSDVIEDTIWSGASLGLDIVDKDGSQTLDITITGFPAGATIVWPTTPAGITLVAVPGGFQITGPSTSSAATDVIAFINGLQVTPPLNSDANFTLTLAGSTTDSSGPSDTFNFTHAVVVRADADAPGVTVTGNGSEDNFIATPVIVTTSDNDGSERLQSVVITGLPQNAGAQFHLVNGAGVVTLATNFAGSNSYTDASGNAYTVTGNGAGGITLTSSAGTGAQQTAAIIAAAASLEVRPGTNIGTDFTLSATATTIEATLTDSGLADLTASTSSTHLVDVLPIADTVTLSGPAIVTTAEDTRIRLSTLGFGAVQADADGSEVLTFQMTNLPAGTIFVDSVGVQIGTPDGSGGFTLTSAEFNAAFIRPPVHFHGTLAGLTITAVTVDSNNQPDGRSLTAPSSRWQSDSVTFDLVVTPVADAPTVAGQSTVAEDTTVNFGANISYALVDSDGSEVISMVEIADIPAGWTITFTSGPGLPPNVTFGGGVYTITGTPAQIRTAVDTFTAQPPTNTDANSSTTADFTVRVTTRDALDVGNPSAQFATTVVQHSIVVAAVADVPTVNAPFTVSGNENGVIPLFNGGNQITAGRSPDQDGSESLSIQLRNVPVGASITADPTTLAANGGTIRLLSPGVWEISVSHTSGSFSGSDETRLNAIVASIDLRPIDFSGTVLIDVVAITTETGPEIAVMTAEAHSTITVNVSPVVDPPIVKGNAIGLEDTLIPVPISVTLGDKDGSEAFTVMRITNVPAGARLFGAGGAEIFGVAGVYTLTPADVAVFSFRPPLDYSTAGPGADIILQASVDVTDSSSLGNVSSTFGGFAIPITITGVADAPAVDPVSYVGLEDQPILIGQSIIDSITAPGLAGLRDVDGSERLSFIIAGLPAGTIPSVGTYIGGGRWQVDAADLSSLTLPPVPNFSGDYSATYGLTVTSVSQEVDGDQEQTTVPVSIIIQPEVATAIDGFASWNQNVTTNEDNNISLSGAATNALNDNDGSETVLTYTFDLSGILAATTHTPAITTVDDFITNYVTGTFTRVNASGAVDAGGTFIRVDAANMGGVSLRATAFVDSNRDFAIPVVATIQDTNGLIGPANVTVVGTQSGNFAINLVGDADLPTVTVPSSTPSVAAGDRIALPLGGASTDTDNSSFGQPLSESVYFILKQTSNPGSVFFRYTDAAGNPIGIEAGNGTWLFTPAEIAMVQIATDGAAGSTGGLIGFTLTTVAVENDGDLNQNTAPFTVQVTPYAGGAGLQDPTTVTRDIAVTSTSPNEDTTGAFTVAITSGPPATSSSLVIRPSDLPVGVVVQGAIWNPVEGVWVARLNPDGSSSLRLLPPADYSGSLSIPVTVNASNAFNQNTTFATNVPITVVPVTDGIAIAGSGAGPEDRAGGIALSISLAERDVDGSETIDNPVVITLNNGATLIGFTAVSSVGGVSTYNVTTAQVASGLFMRPATHVHGSVTVGITTTSRDGAAASMMDTISFTVPVTAVADAPTVIVPVVALTGTEDQAIVLSGLSAVLVDTDGSEILSVVISGIPAGSILSFGSNNGADLGNPGYATWTVPVSALSNPAFTILPPLNYAGTMTLTLTAIAVELPNGSEASSSSSFSVVVAPIADTPEILAQNVVVNGSGDAVLALNVRMADERGALAGELAPEVIQMTFSGIPSGGQLFGGQGGSISDLGNGAWRFTGTEDQANAVRFAPGALTATGSYVVQISAVTIDGASTLATPVTDSFRINVTAPPAGTQATGSAAANTINGGAGNDVLDGAGGNDTISGNAGNDRIIGGAGIDLLSGGLGADRFVWNAGDAIGGTDRITDFQALNGDRIDLANLLQGFSATTSILSDFVQTTSSAGNTTIRVDVNGAAGGTNFVDLVVVDGATSLDLNQMRTNGSLIV